MISIEGDGRFFRNKQKYKNQFEPFQHELFDSTDLMERSHYNHTVFRFPLRTKEMKSDLTDVVYNRQKVRN